MSRTFMHALSIAGFSLMTVIGSSSLFAGQETAWAQKSLQDCQQELNEENMKNFESELSPLTYREYMGLNPQQKKSAMDYADKNNMSPDSAVMRVMSDSKK